MKYPIGIQDFKSIVEDGYTYVDKTALVYRLVTEGKIYFLSRPRRFGKSLLVSTLEYYFKGEKRLFSGLAIERLEKDWKNYPVFHIDFNGNDFTVPNTLQNMLLGYVEQWEREYAYVPNTRFSVGERFSQLLAHVHDITGNRCVVLVDEYDKPILDVLCTGYSAGSQECANWQQIEDSNRETLKGFYSVFKAADSHLKFVLLTGVTKFSQVSVFSGFNQPKDISLDSRYDALCGITQDELNTVLEPSVEEFAHSMHVSVGEMKSMLKEKYDGYHFGRKMTDIYNPFSLLNALDSKELNNYWFASGTPTYLVRLLNHTHENLNELTGKYYLPADFIDYMADVERPLPMIYQSGYLTIKGYNQRFNTFLLDFPNNEVKEGFVNLIANNYLRTSKNSAVEAMMWVQAIETGDINLFFRRLTAFFASIPYSMRRKENEHEKERYFHYTFYLLFRLMSTYIVLTEQQQSEGRADCIIETPNDIYIFEFKLDGTANEALSQIDAKGYAKPYIAGSRKIHKIGVSFSSYTGTIEEWIVG